MTVFTSRPEWHEMVVSRLWPVTVRHNFVLDCIAGSDKTAKLKSKYSYADYRVLRDAVNYAKGGEKTEQKLFCQGINCASEIVR